MDGHTPLTLTQISLDLQRYPPAVLEEYTRALGEMSRMANGERLLWWARHGLALAQQAPRSWEAAAEYFKASPTVLPVLTWEQFPLWAQGGYDLCQQSPSMAVAYFRAGPASVPHIRPSRIPQWVSLGQRFYKGTWKSTALAVRFFEASPSLLASLPFPDLERFVAFLERLTTRSYDLATECLVLGEEVFPKIGEHRDAFVALLSALSETASWREVKACFEAAARALPRLERSQRGRFLRLAECLAKSGYANLSTFLLEASEALAQVDASAHATLLGMAEALQAVAPEALPDFLKNAPAVLERITLPQMEAWFAEGVRLLRTHKEAGLAYFRLETVRAEQVLEALSSAVELGRVKDLMRLYCRALAGSQVEIASSQELVQKGIGWVDKEKPTTEGTTVYLPPLADRYPSKAENFAWYKVIATHQVAHLEFGSFTFAYHRPSTCFKDLRPTLKPPSLPTQEAWLTDMQRFFALFPEKRLALDIFTVLEDGRLDARVKREYAGIRTPYQRVQEDSLAQRPPLESLPAREALVELLVRLTLQQYRLPTPFPYLKEARALARLVRILTRPATTVEDTAEATLRAYAIISRVPNEHLPQEQWQEQDYNQEQEEQEQQEDTSLHQVLQSLSPQDRPERQPHEQPYQSPKQVDYRGEFKPELVQLLAKLKQTGEQRQNQSASDAITRELLEQLLKESAELEAEQGNISQTVGMFANNLMREAGIAQPPPVPAFGQGPLMHIDDEGGPLETTEPHTYLYDEWDFRAGDYKPRWCMVREKSMAEGDTAFWDQTLQTYAALVNQVRKQFELVVPETFRKIKRLKDGEEFDLDAVLEAMVDRRAGLTPSEKVYWRRNKVERDVAVVFVLDMSASTAEAIEESKQESWDAPDDPVEYMLWLRTRRGEHPRRTYKRIIDLEKESLVILIQALQTLGDQYGIYGFSGYGRENVEFYAIKDIKEAFGDCVKRRIDKISPLHATRMGPAIRHAITKLEAVEAKTKVLFLLSDGRPQDRGYSREGVEKEYAVHDTHKALLEAKQKNIIPFCLTVDKNGHDYLKTMCADIGYEVLADIYSLPQRLPFLYRRLTV
ncbi:MAG: VWA domain-containing protein [Dehalococcoidia bacterium]|nr:VWA domain-containing protein [Dehalococcoidia bacterium]